MDCILLVYIELSLIARFGSSFSNATNESSRVLGALNILHCNGHFPHVAWGEGVSEADHFMTLSPIMGQRCLDLRRLSSSGVFFRGVSRFAHVLGMSSLDTHKPVRLAARDEELVARRSRRAKDILIELIQHPQPEQ